MHADEYFYYLQGTEPGKKDNIIENYLTLKKMTGSEIDSYLTSKGHEMYAKTVNTYFFIRIEEDALA